MMYQQDTPVTVAVSIPFGAVAADPLPAKVKVGWMDYRIETWNPRDAMGANRTGETSHTGAIIRVDVSYGTRKAATTLLHELFHAIGLIWKIDDKDDEERSVTMLENGLATVWRDNPTVLAWIGRHLIGGTD